MAEKDSTNRTKERREREKEMGMERLDISLHKTTLKMLIKLVKDAGYDVNSREKSRGINGVLTQLIYEVYSRRDKVNLNRRDQQGFILAQKLKTLKKSGLEKGISLKKATRSVESESPTDYLDTEDAEWRQDTLLQLIKKYQFVFAPKQLPSKKKVGKSHGEGDSDREDFVITLSD